MNRQQYLDLITPAMEVVVKKHQDYNQGSVELHSYFPFGHRSYVQMLHVKMQRLISLAQADHDPVNESVRDTLNDMINYAVFMLEFLNIQENK